ncbi:hypothetical protein AAHA92_33862 [Salvia divinorum]|uniref:Glabrous enhancer-binding protein-like DBD domain-containing protein n=1 Tax=Salvia divinorum TaxID=28513 RepID=A0ABD1FH34_SALDI
MGPKPQRDELPSLHQGTNSNSEIRESEDCLTPLMKAKAGSGGKMSSNCKVFCEDDIVCLLNKLVVFWAGGKSNKWVEFYRFVKDDLSKEYTSRQVSEKIRSLNEKFHNTRVKPSNPHESTVYELSNVLWKDELNDENKTKRKPKKRRKTDTEGEANTILAIGESYKKTSEGEANTNLTICQDEIGLDEFESSFPYLCASFKMPGCPLLSIKECVSIGRKYAQELEDEWREHRAQQLRFELKKLAHTRYFIHFLCQSAYN